ncbi:MAG: O-antigen ligase family protein [candidate division WOR-3 bacterium]
MTTRLPADRRTYIGPVLSAILVVTLLARYPVALLAAVGLASLVTLILLPEVTLSLFLAAGVIKAPLASLATAAGIDMDITLILALVLVGAILFRGMKAGFRTLVPSADCIVPLGSLSLVILLSALLGPETPYGREKAFRFLTLTNLAVVAPFVCLNRDSSLSRFLVANIILGIVMLPLGHVSNEGLSAFGSTHIATGRALGLGLLASVYLGLRRMPPFYRFVWLAVGVALLAGFLLSGSRGSFVALVTSAAVTCLLALATRRGRRHVLALAAVAGVAALGVTALAPTAVETMNRRLTAAVADPLTFTARTRLERATAAIDAFAAHPLFGTGIGGFDALFSIADTGRGDYPHNVFLEVAAELGLAGLAAFLLLMSRSLRRPLRAHLSAVRRPDTSFAALPLFVIALTCYALVNSLFSGDLNDNRLLFAALGMCFIRLEKAA